MVSSRNRGSCLPGGVGAVPTRYRRGVSLWALRDPGKPMKKAAVAEQSPKEV